MTKAQATKVFKAFLRKGFPAIVEQTGEVYRVRLTRKNLIVAGYTEAQTWLGNL